MKKLISTTFILFALAACGYAQTAAAPVKFQRFGSYFEKNNSNLKGETSFLAFTTQQQFDKVFGTAATMGKNDFMPPDVFKSKIVVAAIKRGALRTYEDVKITSEKGKLYVSYNVNDDAPGSATFSSPLIVAVPKGKYKEIVFVENGKQTGTGRVQK